MGCALTCRICPRATSNGFLDGRRSPFGFRGRHSVTKSPAVIYYVRHAESESNTTRVLSYKAVDPDLTERGRRQAREVATFLAGEPIGPAPIFTSPLRRAVQTAHVIAEPI